MHAILLTLGTDGDLFPYVGLGANLRARGHRVTLASSESYRFLATEHSFDFRPLMSHAEADDFLADPDLWHPYKGALLGASWAVRHLQRHFELIAELAKDPDAVLIANPALFAARIVHDKLGTPIASLILRQPWVIPKAFTSRRFCLAFHVAAGAGAALGRSPLLAHCRCCRRLSWSAAR